MPKEGALSLSAEYASSLSSRIATEGARNEGEVYLPRMELTTSQKMPRRGGKTPRRLWASDNFANQAGET